MVDDTGTTVSWQAKLVERSVAGALHRADGELRLRPPASALWDGWLGGRGEIIVWPLVGTRWPAGSSCGAFSGRLHGRAALHADRHRRRFLPDQARRDAEDPSRCSSTPVTLSLGGPLGGLGDRRGGAARTGAALRA